MAFVGILYALLCVAALALAVAFMWSAVGPLGALLFAAAIWGAYRLVRLLDPGPPRRPKRDQLNAFQQPLADDDRDDPTDRDPER